MLKREPLIWTPAAKDGLMVLLDARGQVAWDSADDDLLMTTLFQWRVAGRALAHLEVVTDRMLTHEKAQPGFATRDRRLASMSWAILADSRPRLEDRKRLLSRDMQQDLWREAA